MTLKHLKTKMIFDIKTFFEKRLYLTLKHLKTKIIFDIESFEKEDELDIKTFENNDELDNKSDRKKSPPKKRS